MSLFVDPFEELDAKMMSDMLMKKRDAFLALLDTPRTEAMKAEVGKARKDPFLNAVYLFKDYYELKAMSGRTAVQDAQIATIETQYPKIAKAYNDGKLKAMLVPWEEYKALKSKGIGSREDALRISTLEEAYPTFKQMTRGKGRRRTGRGRRARGRHNRTKTRRL